jgi:hypothetical protein
VAICADLVDPGRANIMLTVSVQENDIADVREGAE